jgi:hypothetical protein
MKLEKTFDGLQIREVAEVKMADFATNAYVGCAGRQDIGEDSSDYRR